MVIPHRHNKRSYCQCFSLIHPEVWNAGLWGLMKRGHLSCMAVMAAVTSVLSHIMCQPLSLTQVPSGKWAALCCRDPFSQDLQIQYRTWSHGNIHPPTHTVLVHTISGNVSQLHSSHCTCPLQGPQQIILITGIVWYITDQLKFHLYLNSIFPGPCVLNKRRFTEL